MKYDVVWLTAAEQDLAEIWMRSSDREAVTLAAYRIEAFLRSRATAFEKAEPKARRFVAAEPLVVEFQVSAADRRVTVIGVAIWKQVN